MEEEAARITQGQVPKEEETFVMAQKDALPPSFNAIFKPPENYNNASSNPSAEVAVSKDSNGIQTQEEELEVPQVIEIAPLPQQEDYDSDEGVGVDISVEKGKESPEAVLNPTDEEVDAALAELDSIPDGGCDAGEVEGEDDEDEDWSYYKMEPQQQNQNDDLLVSEASKIAVEKDDSAAPLQPQDNLLSTKGISPSDEDDDDDDWAYYKMNPQQEQQQMTQEEDLPVPEASKIAVENEIALAVSPQIPDNFVLAKGYSPSASPPTPGSPRTVEGFVTSVELNTPEESYNTNLAINQSTEYFNGGQIEQSSGPFSVYVSSSPEPASIETPPVNLHSPMSPNPPVEVENMDEVEVKPPYEELGGASVEIVHAQSTVEVMSESPIEFDLPAQDFSPIPDIMTQSFSGDNLPTEPYIDNYMIEHMQNPIHEIAEGTEQEQEFEENYDQYGFSQTRTSNESELLFDSSSISLAHQIYESTNITNTELGTTITCISPLDGAQTTTTTSIITDTVREFEDVSHEVSQSFQEISAVDDAFDVDSKQIETNPPEYLDESYNPEPVELSSQQAQFIEEANTTREVTLDPMAASFHFDDAIPSDLISASVQPEMDLEVEESQESRGEVSELSEKLSQIQIEEPEPAAKTEVKKPLSAPRTTMPRSAPPKPSPRSVDSKSTSGRITSASSLNTTTSSSTGIKQAPKRPSSLNTNLKTLKKPDAVKTAVAAATTATTAKSRLSGVTSRTTTLHGVRSTTSATANKVASAASSKTKTTTSTTMTKPKSLSQAGTAAPKTTLAAKGKFSSTTSTTATTTPVIPKSKPSTTTTTTTATKRLPSRPTQSTTATTRIGSATKIPNGVAASKIATKTTTSTKTTLSAPRKPLTTRTTVATSTKTSAAVANKSFTSTTKTSNMTTAMKQKITTTLSPSTTKDSKNTTNRMLSTSRISSAKSNIQTTTSRTTASTPKTRLTPSRTNKTPVLKNKKEPAKTAPKEPIDTSLANGENKIVEEETSVEVKDKLMEEERVDATEKLLDDVASKVEEMVAANQGSALVNGDH